MPHIKTFVKRSIQNTTKKFIVVVIFISLSFVQKGSSQNVSPYLLDSLFSTYQQKDSTLLVTSNYIVCLQSSNCKLPKTIKVHRKITEVLLIVSSNDVSILRSNECIRKIAPASIAWKLSPALLQYQQSNKINTSTSTSFVITASNIDTLLNSFSQRRIQVKVTHLFRETQSAVIECSWSVFLKSVLPQPGMYFADISLAAEADMMVSGYNRSISNIHSVDQYFPNANGKNIVIGIKENKIAEQDIDLQRRINASSVAASTTDIHASTIATLAGGAGNSFYSGKGVASKCTFFPSTFSNLFPDSSGLLMQQRVTVQNHSYGTQIQTFYGAEAMSYDVQTNQHPSLVHVFSSGNSGTDVAITGSYANLNGFANLTGNFKLAKNVITVAAVDTGSKLATFSSCGPTYDGRLAPQLAALGPNGTSEAAAIVSGAVALLQQVYKDSNVQTLPSASLVKSLLYNTCDDTGDPGIDYRSGFGIMNLQHAVKCLMQKQYDGGELHQMQTWTKMITIPAGVAQVKATLCWTDTAGTVNNNKALVNDLDLELVQMSTGAVYKPWVLSSIPNRDSLKAAATRRTDSLNTAEQVSINLPTAGQYLIRVNARKIATVQKQSFAIAYTWDTLNTAYFTNPVHAADINRNESPTVTIKWKAILADTNTRGNLLITYNGGQAWQLLGSNIQLSKQIFGWTVPDTTAVAQLRIDAPFGTIYSTQFVIAPLTKLSVDYLCPDSMRLSWQKHALTNQYQLYALGDTAFIKPVAFVADSFIVMTRIERPENVFAVQPLLRNGLEANRSIAVDVRNQGVNCYYRSLIAETVSEQVKLTLLLSYVNDVDSVVFEKATAGNSLLSVLQSIRPVINQFSYNYFDAAPVAGTNYYRAKIWVRGRFFYTETVSVIHNGKTVVLAYPNPVQKGQPLNLLMPENIGECTFQLTDATGRIVTSIRVNTFYTIHLSGYPSGVYWYRLVPANGKTIAQGKILVVGR